MRLMHTPASVAAACQVVDTPLCLTKRRHAPRCVPVMLHCVDVCPAAAAAAAFKGTVAAAAAAASYCGHSPFQVQTEARPSLPSTSFTY